MPMSLLEAAVTLNTKTETWQGSGDTETFYILIASLALAFLAFVILMRVRF
jgi:hypothetical protein